MKRVLEMTRAYSQMHRADNYSEDSNLSSLAKSLSFHLQTKLFWVRVQLLSLTVIRRFCCCFKQGVPWYSENRRVWVYSETFSDMTQTYCQI